MNVGTIKWFDTKRGFGFIVGDHGEDIFVHFSVIDGAGYRKLQNGASVEYEMTPGPKGWTATRVRRLAPDQA